MQTSSRNAVWIGILLLCIMPKGQAAAAGLIRQLPPDGAWSLFTTVTSSEPELQVPKDSKFQFDSALTGRSEVWGSLKLSSVGRKTVDGRNCRWIEIEVKSPSPGSHPEIVVKMLIPEKVLVEDTDPLAQVIRLYVQYDLLNEGQPTLIEDEKRKRYELDRVRLWLLPPAGTTTRLNEQTISTKAGTFSCQGDCGEHRFQSTGIVENSAGSWSGTFQRYRHENAPFGVVSLSLIGNAIEEIATPQAKVRMKTDVTQRAVLTETGIGAKSRFSRVE
ncbi:hypothetical protein Pan44_03480 [Caulifigura coniformis]|uniref:Uncharacterized protein n=1 Tax=Caulifigura coniformis TaxID=2527983 RepID=A0A517S890_9PLAN|nr:hypothetical protein [Caulifigura coniformis]QDT52339.1 hypothetical protein Pan44_03480 [Caulifigura coniformis]